VARRFSEPELRKGLAARVRALRHERGLSGRECAKRAGMKDRYSLYSVEQKGACSLETLVALVAALETTTDYLLGLTLEQLEVAHAV